MVLPSLKKTILNEYYNLRNFLVISHKSNLSSIVTTENIYRTIFVIVAFCLCFVIVIFRLFDVMILSEEPKRFIKDLYDNSDFERKEIIDRNGTLLAVNLNTASLYANPKIIFNIKETVENLKQIFPELSNQTLNDKLNSNKNFVWIKRNITPKEQLAVNRLGEPGLNFHIEEKRFYPQGPLFSHIIGYVGIDGLGLSGIEKQFDKYLRNEDLTSEKLELSLDSRIQNVVREELQNSMSKFKAEAALGLVLNVNNGEVLSLVSLPDFNPNNMQAATQEQLFNRVTKGAYELGSVFKVCSMAMALEANVTDLNDVYYVKDPIKISKFNIRDFSVRNKTWLTVPEIFMFSSNIGLSRIITEMGTKMQKDFISKFHLDRPIDIEIPEISSPIIPNDNQWKKLKTVTISYGHGIAITPLHMASITAAIVNGGYLFSPTLIKNSEKTNKAIRVISKQTSDKMRKLLYMTVQKGTGKKAKVAGYYVGGKTGSGEKAIKGGYSKKAKLSSFVAVFPIDKPQFVVFVMLDDPKPVENIRSATGGLSAAPLSAAIIEKIGPLLNIKPDLEYNDKIKKDLWLEYQVDENLLALQNF